jgi:hypothetical protein
MGFRVHASEAFSFNCMLREAWTSHPVKIFGFNMMSRTLKSGLPLGLDNNISALRQRGLQNA